MTFEAIYNPDGLLIAVFANDSDQLVPTQKQAADAYFREYCSEFCTRVAYFGALSDIPQEI